MSLNWLDLIILLILAISAIVGLIKGFVREVIGLAAVIFGLIFAARNYIGFSEKLRPAFAHEAWPRLIAFLLIFLAFLLAGWILGLVLSQLMKGPLRAANHILGGLFGFIKGALISAVFVLALIVFPVNRNDLLASRLAPSCLALARALIHLVPQELKIQFREAYRNLKGERAPYGKKI